MHHLPPFVRWHHALPRRAALLFGAALLLPAPAFALTVNVTEIAPGTAFWDNTVGQAQPSSVFGGGSLASVFGEAAKVWQAILPEPYTLNVQVGWARPQDINDYWVQARPTQVGSTPGTDAETGRWNNGMVFYSADPAKSIYYIPPNPADTTGYGPLQTLSANLGGGQINTGRYRLATASPPLTGGSYPVDPNIPTGAVKPEYGNAFAAAIHEIGHMLGLDYDPVLYDSSPLYSRTSSPDTIVIESGPFKGMAIPYSIGAGPHVNLPYPKGVSNLDPSGQWISTPEGIRRVYNASLSDAETVLVGALGKWHVARLTGGLTYATYPTFSTDQRTLEGLSLNGAAATLNVPGSSPGLHLTDAKPDQSGSVFLSTPMTLNGHSVIQARFGFRIGTGSGGSDGLAFVIHRDARGTVALGNLGEGLGYGNNPTYGDILARIFPSLAVEFDTYQNAFDPHGNHVAITLNGDVANHLAWADPGFDLDDGNEHFGWLSYNFLSRQLALYLSDTDARPSTPLIEQRVDLSMLMGDNVYFGFTAATGGGFNTHDITTWDLALSHVPEPAAALLFSPALAGLALARRRRT